MKSTRFLLMAGLMVFILQLLSACSSSHDSPFKASSAFSGQHLTIVSGSENKSLQGLIELWAFDHDVSITVDYKGSVDIYRLLQQGKSLPYDAVWPANNLWLELGDEQKIVKHAQSIMRSPVVLGLKQSTAQQLGWDKKPVKIADILQAAEQNKFRLAMTSATQSNSGASAYLGFLYALAGYPDTLTQANLDDKAVQEKVKRLLRTLDRSSGSSGWLKDAIIQSPQSFDAMFNYEAMLIEANQALTENKQEPLCAIYPEDGLSVADSPLGFVNKGDEAKEKLFLALQEYLLSEEVQHKLENMGRRTGLLGMTVEKPDTTIWNPSWCIKAEIDIASIPTPQKEVIQQALNLYQTDLRKPSLTIWALDISGSMQGMGIQDLRRAMYTLLDPQESKTHLLQPSKKDITIIIPFNHDTQKAQVIKGNEPAKLQQALRYTQNLQADGGTDLYRALYQGLVELQPYYSDGTLWDYLPAIVAMTDGRSDDINRHAFELAVKTLPFGRDIPIHAIAFGDADRSQLEALTQQSVGRLFITKDNLPDTLRKAKGYN